MICRAMPFDCTDRNSRHLPSDRPCKELLTGTWKDGKINILKRRFHDENT